MKNKIITVVLILTLSFSVVSCGSSGSDSADSKQDTKTEEPSDAEGDATQEEKEPEKENLSFNIGETWTVDGQWKITVNSVTATDYRNEYAERQPAASYIIDYTYENLGYEDEYSDGLFVDFTLGQIVDNSNVMGYSYPGEQTKYAQEVPVGATCNAESVIGVDNPGDFKIIYNCYDGNGVDHKATFNFVVQ